MMFPISCSLILVFFFYEGECNSEAILEMLLTYGVCFTDSCLPNVLTYVLILYVDLTFHFEIQIIIHCFPSFGLY